MDSSDPAGLDPGIPSTGQEERERTRAAMKEIAGNAAEYQAQMRTHAEEIAKAFHLAYERLAPLFGYATREASAVPWEEVPNNNRELMIATVLATGLVTSERLAQEGNDEALRLHNELVKAEGHKERRLQDWNAEVEGLQERLRLVEQRVEEQDALVLAARRWEEAFLAFTGNDYDKTRDEVLKLAEQELRDALKGVEKHEPIDEAARRRTLLNALRYIRGDDIAGYPAHMPPHEVAGAALASLDVPVGEREIAVERLHEWYDKSMPLVAALAIYGEGVNLGALVQKAQALNEHVPRT